MGQRWYRRTIFVHVFNSEFELNWFATKINLKFVKSRTIVVRFLKLEKKLWPLSCDGNRPIRILTTRWIASRHGFPSRHWRQRAGTNQSVVPDLHAQERHADARAWAAARPRRRGEAAPVPAVLEVVQLEPPAGAAHSSPHRREAVQMLILRQTLQTAQPRTTAYQTTHGYVDFSYWHTVAADVLTDFK